MAEGEGPRIVAEFSDYAGMLDALRMGAHRGNCALAES